MENQYDMWSAQGSEDRGLKEDWPTVGQCATLPARSDKAFSS